MSWPAVLNMLRRSPANWRGPGINHAGEAFDPELVARPLFQGRAVAFWFRAKSPYDLVFHEELGLIGLMEDGAPG